MSRPIPLAHSPQLFSGEVFICSGPILIGLDSNQNLLQLKMLHLGAHIRILIPGILNMFFILYSVVVCISLSIFTHNNKHVTKCSCLGWRMLQDVSSVYLWSCTSAFFAIEPSAAVSQGKLTSLLIALLVITECSCVKPGRYFKLTSVLSPNSQVKECSTEDQLKVLTVPHAISATSRRTKW